MTSRFPPRDRSPHRYGDRRPAPAHGSGPPRGHDDANSIPLGREPPRGPKALVDSPRGAPFGPSGSRGRGFGGRGDFRDRDRDPRDLRDAPPPPFRRDADRDWPRRDRGFDSRDSRAPFGRGRSRSPPPIRNFRDSRDPPARSPDIAPRSRRNSRDGPVGPGSAISDTPPFRGGRIRGRGRGGDRERGRGRGAPGDNRELFRRRSRSRDPWRERDRDRDWENDRRDRFDSRREDDRRSERDERERLPDRSDPWKEPKVSPTTPMPPPSSSLPSSTVPLSSGAQQSSSADDAHDSLRRNSIQLQSATRDSRRPSERHEPPPSLPDKSSSDRPTPQFSPPPSAPEVPAFGSISRLIQDQGTTIPTGPSSEAGRVPSFGGAVKPPTGPKADRVDAHHAPDFRSAAAAGSPIQNKVELSLRPTRPSLTSSSSEHQRQEHAGLPPITGRPTTPDSSIQRSSTLSNTPTGPRPRSSGSPTAPTQSLARRPSSSGRGGSPQQLNNRPPRTSPRMSFGSVPTAPRAFQRSGAPRGGAKASNQWVRPGYSNQTPPAASSVSPAKREYREDKDAVSTDQFIKRPSSDAGDLERPDDKGSSVAALFQEERSGEVDSRYPDSKDLIADQPGEAKEGENLSLLFRESSGEETDEEDDLDEEDFNRSEEKFEKEMRTLAASMPLPPLKDPVIVGLLLKIQMLGMIAEGAVPAHLDLPSAAMEIERPDRPPTILPLSSKDANEMELSEAPPPISGHDLKPPEILPEAVPSVESLPFLHSGPPTPFSDMESFQETLKSHNRIQDALRQELGKQQKDISIERESLRQEYARHYKPWRLAVTEMDRKREESKPEPPPPTPPPVLAPPPVPEGRRGFRLNSELDFQNALKASAITAQEESARRRDKEVSAKPDMSREAPIPEMFDPKTRKASIFQDTNQIVEPARAAMVFGFHPPPNDFTQTEHKTFTDAFMAYPKKWGKIAETLPGRTFQQCVTHYYLTKEEIKYKAKLNRRWTTKKGRGRKTVRPAKTNALMADLGVARPEYDGGDEPDSNGNAQTAVTDSGRPRRAAAPTFGESNPDTAESSAPTPNSGKRGGGNAGSNTNNKEARDAKDANVGGEQAATDKPATTRRGGRGGGRGGRRQKAQQQSAPITPIAAAPPKQEVDQLPAKEITTSVPPVLKEKDEQEKANQETASRQKTGRSRTKEPSQSRGPGIDSAAAGGDNLGIKESTEGGYGSLQPTSYWSVQEQRDFPDLVSHYGKDFDSISQFMKTKTATMVKNYFQRRIDSGKTELEELALIAEAKKLRGEPTGPLPTPNVMPKRRYEATPSAVGPRPLAPNTEAAEQNDRSLAPKNKSTGTAGGPPPTIQARPSVEKERVQPRYQPLAPQATAGGAPTVSVLSASEEPQSSTMSSQGGPPQRVQQQGPRIGYFSDDRRDVRQVLVQEPLDATMTGMPQGNNNIGSMSAAPESARRNIVSRPQDTQDHVRYQPVVQPNPMVQTTYLHPQASTPAVTSPRTHSRRTSQNISSTAASPVQQHPLKIEPDQGLPAAELKPRPGYLHSGQMSEVGRPSTLAPPPPKEVARPSSTPAQVTAEPSRHVPAKRSNIMNILNDEPEEPQPPRKRFASDQATGSGSAPGPFPPSRPVYTGSQSASQPSHQSRPDGPGPAVQQQQQQQQQQQNRAQYVPTGAHASQMQQHQQSVQHQQIQGQVESGRQYPEQPQHPGYSAGPGTTGPASQDWLARFDPRGQQSTQQAGSSEHQRPRLTSHQSSNHAYSSTVSHGSVPQQSGMQPISQHQHAQNQSLQHHALPQSRQAPSLHTQGHQAHGSIGSANHDSPVAQQFQAFNQGIGSPIQRHHSISYNMRGPHQGSASPVQTPVLAPTHSHHQHPGQVGGYANEGHHHAQQGQQKSQHQAANGHMLGHHQHGDRSSHNPPPLYAQHSQAAPSRHQMTQQQEQQIHHHQRRQSLGSLAQQQQQQQQQQQSGPPFGRNTPPPSHIQSIPRHASHAPVTSSSTGLNLNSRSYTPPQPQQTILQHPSHSQAGGSGMTYSGSGAAPHQAHQAHSGTGQQQNTGPGHPIHIQPRQSGPGGPGGHHGGYPQDNQR